MATGYAIWDMTFTAQPVVPSTITTTEQDAPGDNPNAGMKTRVFTINGLGATGKRFVCRMAWIDELPSGEVLFPQPVYSVENNGLSIVIPYYMGYDVTSESSGDLNDPVITYTYTYKPTQVVSRLLLIDA